MHKSWQQETLNLLFQAIVIFGFTDFYEYAYHWCGHRFVYLWSIHRHHHLFFNPSPFAVIADEYLDQFVRTIPMILIPLILPINIDLLFAIFATLFYGYVSNYYSTWMKYYLFMPCLTTTIYRECTYTGAMKVSGFRHIIQYCK